MLEHEKNEGFQNFDTFRVLCRTRYIKTSALELVYQKVYRNMFFTKTFFSWADFFSWFEGGGIPVLLFLGMLQWGKPFAIIFLLRPLPRDWPPSITKRGRRKKRWEVKVRKEERGIIIVKPKKGGEIGAKLFIWGVKLKVHAFFLLFWNLIRSPPPRHSRSYDWFSEPVLFKKITSVLSVRTSISP